MAQGKIRISKYTFCTITLILLIFLYQLPIAVILDKNVRRIGLLLVLFCTATTLLIDRSFKLMMIAISALVFSLCLYYTCWSIYPEFNNFGNLLSQTMQYFFFWCYMLLSIIFINADLNSKRLVLSVWWVITVITMTTTIIGELRFPGVARLLAGIATEEQSTYYKHFNIGSYNTVYGVMMSLPVWMYISKYRKGIVKALSILMLVYSYFFLLITEYMFAVVGAFFLLGWFVLFSNNPGVKHLFILFLIVVLLGLYLVLEWNTLIGYLIDYTNLHDMGSFNRRLVSIQYLLKTGQQSGDILKRGEHYMTSINAFLRHPFIGGLFHLDSLVLGRHSELFDLLGSLGVVGGGYVVYLFRYYIFRNVEPLRESKIHRYIIVSVVLFGYLTIINLVFMFHNVAFSLFILPYLVASQDK